MTLEQIKKTIQKLNTRTLVTILAVSAGVAVIAAVQIVSGLQAYANAAGEYAGLREEYAPYPQAQPASTEEEPAPSAAEINPDYVGWIRIDGTVLDYPVVQGRDNSHYLTTSFLGTQSKLGAIFLDFRCTDGLESPHTMLYGHNARDGSMFTCLLQYQEDGYLEQHPEIQITLPDGSEETFQVFSVKATDITDPGYQLEFADSAAFDVFAAGLGAPEGTGRILSLSTCLDNNNLDSRLLVHAAAECMRAENR